MNEEIKEKLELLKFRGNALGGMDGRIEDVEFTAIEHPIKGVVFIVSHVGPREAVQFEFSIPVDSSLQHIAAALQRAFDQVHPEREIK